MEPCRAKSADAVTRYYFMMLRLLADVMFTFHFRYIRLFATLSLL